MSTVQLPLLASPHNNQQLFSDHYLDVVLPKHPGWQALAAQAMPVMGAIASIYARYTPGGNEAQTENELVRPVLEALGHTFEVQAPLATPDGTKTPDYVFYRDQASRLANRGKVLTEDLLKTGGFAVGDAKHWDRKLDVTIKGRTSDPFSNKNPAYQIAFYIQHSGTDWGILTNGHLWRLYHRDTAHKLDRFYEVDLPALLAGEDIHRFLYFYAFFHRTAFESHPLGVAQILRTSRDYARGIGESLKEQVFDALRHLAQGFLDYQPNGLQPDEPTLKAIYDNSLIVLYRLLFILYAEARELLPIRENATYRQFYSLHALSHEIAGRLTSGLQLLPGSATHWRRLQDLFRIINDGSPQLAVATYNGGLFDPTKHPFLEQYVVGDAHMQHAIDILARVGGEFIDYRDLAEQHLGTIYEGLLEYHLAEVPPEAGWTVDLVNERGERKKTGSYYTPNYIVKYIVEQTVGPMLRAAVENRRDDRAKIDAILNTNVLDPAMGSGYFLVEATEYIARFLVDQALTPSVEGAGEPEADLAYWKRRVAQSCIYGVDLNPLAVELAKLSLWLSTVAKDQPLSFLDHHLRAGNSLLGARVSDLQQEPAAPGKRARQRAQERAREQERQVAAGQLAFFDDDTFRRNMSIAVDAMWLIEGTPGTTVEEVKQQERIYADLRETLTRRYGRLADLVTATRFGIEIDATFWPALADYALGRSIALPPKLLDTLTTAEELAERERFFHWELEFPEVFFDRRGEPLREAAGFDVVIGNPPYVRQERLRPYKPYFEAEYSDVYAGTADLFVYFFARGIGVAQERGLLSYISSNGWLRADYATRLRSFLRSQVTIETLIDVGDNRVFESAPDVYPAVIVTRREAPSDSHVAQAAVFTRGEGVRRFAEQVAEKLAPVSIHDQVDSGWQLADSIERRVLRRLLDHGISLRDVVSGRIFRGLITGLNELFVVDQAMKDELVRKHESSAEVLKPFLRGEDLRPWYQTPQGRWLILIPAGWTRSVAGPGLDEPKAFEVVAARYPAVADYLEPSAEAARRRYDKGEYWWELRSCDYYSAFEQPKILWPDIGKIPRFSWDTSGCYLGNTGYFVTTDDPALLGFLSSRCTWFVISQTAQGLGERAGLNRYRLFDQFMGPIPIPDAPPDERGRIGSLAMSITTHSRERYALHQRTRQRILSDLGTPGKALNQKLTAWWELDFPAFRDEARKLFKREIPLKERDEWEVWLAERRAEHTRLTAEIVRLETELNARVYALYDLTPAEIQLIEEVTKYQYGEV